MCKEMSAKLHFQQFPGRTYEDKELEPLRQNLSWEMFVTEKPKPIHPIHLHGVVLITLSDTFTWKVKSKVVRLHVTMAYIGGGGQGYCSTHS